jgi:hypothetical protein
MGYCKGSGKICIDGTNEKPVPGAMVTILWDGKRAEKLKTDGNGLFHFKKGVPGQHSFTAVHDSFYRPKKFKAMREAPAGFAELHSTILVT